MTVNKVLFLIVVFITHTIQAAMGFGGSMTAMPFSIRLIGAGDAKFVLTLAALILCILVMTKEYKHVNYRQFAKIVAGMLIGMVIGILIYSVCPMKFLLKPYGALVVAVALKHLFFDKKGEVKKPLPECIMLLILLLSGIIHGMFVSGGALLSVYSTRALGDDKQEFRATITAVWTILDAILLVQLLFGGSCSTATLQLSAITLLPLILALAAGNYLHNRLDQNLFMKIAYVLMAIAGLSALL